MDTELDLQHCGARLVEALAAAQSAQGKISVNEGCGAPSRPLPLFFVQ